MPIYFADGTVATITNAENETTTYAYDLFANQVSVTKPKGVAYQQRSTYDVRNRLANVTDANDNVTRFEYDVNNNLRHQYQPAANDSGEDVHVEYAYDNLNRKREHILLRYTKFGHLIRGDIIITFKEGRIMTKHYKPAFWPWCSYLTTAGEVLVPVFLEIHWILSLFDKHKSEAQRKYKKFIIKR